MLKDEVDDKKGRERNGRKDKKMKEAIRLSWSSNS